VTLQVERLCSWWSSPASDAAVVLLQVNAAAATAVATDALAALGAVAEGTLLGPASTPYVTAVFDEHVADDAAGPAAALTYCLLLSGGHRHAVGCWLLVAACNCWSDVGCCWQLVVGGCWLKSGSSCLVAVCRIK